jgi:methionine-rich copper-binding protein CopC
MISKTHKACGSGFVFLLAAVISTGALAHAHLERSVPSAGSTVQAAPERIELSFNENLEPAFSTIEVVDQRGEHKEQGKADIDPGNGKVLRIALKPLIAGVYKVVWRVVSIDTHRSSGSFNFTVSP